MPKIPILLQSDLVQEAQGGHGEQDGAGGQLLVVGQMQLISADLFRPLVRGDRLRTCISRSCVDEEVSWGSSFARWNVLLSSHSMLSQSELPRT